jgi:hypothetical protein
MKKTNSYLNTLKRRMWIQGMADEDTFAEIESHLLDAVDKGIREGLSLEEAELRALQRFGSVRTIVNSFERERITIMNKTLLALAIFCGIFLAFVDSRPGWNNMGITAGGLLITAALITGLGHPRPWLIGLAIGLWIPLYHILQSQTYMMLLILVIPLVGAYAGWVIRIGSRKILHLA